MPYQIHGLYIFGMSAAPSDPPQYYTGISCAGPSTIYISSLAPTANDQN